MIKSDFHLPMEPHVLIETLRGDQTIIRACVYSPDVALIKGVTLHYGRATRQWVPCSLKLWFECATTQRPNPMPGFFIHNGMVYSESEHDVKARIEAEELASVASEPGVSAKGGRL